LQGCDGQEILTGQDASETGHVTTGVRQDTTGSGQDTTGTGQETTGVGQDTTGTGQDTTGVGHDTGILTVGEGHGTRDTRLCRLGTEHAASETELTVGTEHGTVETGLFTTGAGQDTTGTVHGTSAEGKVTQGSELPYETTGNPQKMRTADRVVSFMVCLFLGLICTMFRKIY